MTTLSIPWRAWYGDEPLDLAFPSGWRVQAYWPADGPDVGAEGIERAFDNPIGSPPIEELAAGKESVAIAVEDISRPAAADRVMPALMRRLERAGVDLESVRVVMAIGTHRPMVKDDIIKKIGQEAADTFDVHNNYPFGNTTDLGTTPRGTPVRISSHFAQAELKIGVGGITPHGGPGFGGGAKVVVPGVASIETIASMHKPGRLGTGLGNVDVELRQEIEHISRHHVGLDAIVNVVPNAHRGVAGLFVGDMIHAHRAGVKLARRVFATEMPREPVDIAICNAYPKDTDFLQHGLGLTIINSSDRPVVKDGGIVVVITASPEGRGRHALYGPDMPYDRHRGGRTERVYVRLRNGQAEKLVYSPVVSPNDARMDAVFRRWDDLVRHLQARDLPERPTVAVFPCGSIQLAA